MATNGASARQWLAENGSKASKEQLLKIRSAITAKLKAITEDNPDENGLLEALDVMDNFLEGQQISATSVTDVNLSTDRDSTPALDTSPLTPNIPMAEPLSAEEKRAKFQELLKKK